MNTFTIEFITPCFCAGADQAKAEIRVPSIRGQLRWWFRALGGTPAEEKQVFGGVHQLKGENKENPARASSVALRVSDVLRGRPWKPFSMQMGSPGAYIWYFASVSGDKTRWWRTPPVRQRGQPPRPGQPNPDGNLPPSTTFKLHVQMRRPLSSRLQEKWDKTLKCFLRFGAIGMRATRCMGDFHCMELPADRLTYENAARLLTDAGFAVQWHPKDFPTWEDSVFEAERQLKALREQHSANSERYGPLGNSKPRQASAVWFRVVRFAENSYGLLLFEAPHERVLDPQSQLPRPLLESPQPYRNR